MSEQVKRYVGIDVGAETIKVAELRDSGGGLELVRREVIEHDKEPGARLLELLGRWDWAKVDGASVTGRFSRLVDLPRVPTKQAQARGFHQMDGSADSAATVVSIGGHGFSVLELRATGVQVFRENSRCSQGTGNFLRQLVARFDLSIEQASALCASIDDPAPLSGRCPVILKTDMTHLANKGEDQARILAGLYDAVCENVQVLLKPAVSPKRVLLTGGVGRSERIRRNFSRFLERKGMELMDVSAEDALFVEALGCARLAVEQSAKVPSLANLLLEPEHAHLDHLPPLKEYLHLVERMPKQVMADVDGVDRRIALGFDIGSTGSKVVAVDVDERVVVWEGYVNTSGNPVGASQKLMQQFVDGRAGKYDLVAVAATGSGREIVGSLMSTCYGVEPVYVLNEIAAHAEGALHFNSNVDTIFEIGGQDAKYIRLAGGRVVDAAMNEACSAGTGSFIEEQGGKFPNVDNVVELGQAALHSDEGVSLGQHCSVFMAEVIDEAVAAGTKNTTIIAGIYDSIIQNYLNRVKGSRSVGQVIFCQGMPFAADALAAAVARQTGSKVIVPPNPGTVGALGIALLALKVVDVDNLVALDPQKMLSAEIESKDTFICKSKKGCGGAGNHCRIERLTTVVENKRQRFMWGGGCSLWDKGTGKAKLPDLAPDPFREREELVRDIIAAVSTNRGNRRVGLTDEFQLKGLLPFFATFLYELGFDLEISRGADQKALKRGIEEANVSFCAPMQQYHGIVAELAERGTDMLFLPMLRGIERVAGEKDAVLCPIVQASPDMMKWDLGQEGTPDIVSPVIDIDDGNLESPVFMEACTRLAMTMGARPDKWWGAYQRALDVQLTFNQQCLDLGAEALSFCEDAGVTPVVVLGRAYTIYNKVLNSNVPAILREQGAIAIPVDCYEVADDVPVFDDIYWGYGQRNLRAAHQARRVDGTYTLWCSNYACGPDSFNLHFYAYIMEGKPFAIIETDGHSGDAGTKTRIEAFLHCVREDLAGVAGGEQVNPNGPMVRPSRQTLLNDLKIIELDKQDLPAAKERNQTIIIPRMGQGAEGAAACLRGAGFKAESLPMPDRESVAIGRRHTSGKECVPMALTLGSLIQRLDKDKDTDEEFAFFMPTACGPCRFGVYNLLHKITLERLGWKERVRIWSPGDDNYFEGLEPGFRALALAGFVIYDLLAEALYDVRPVETRPGAALEIYGRYIDEAEAMLEAAAREHDLSVKAALAQAFSGRLFGGVDLLRRAAKEFAGVKSSEELPTVMMVGEIYVRCDPFANDFLIDKLEAHRIKVRFAPFNEWLEYTEHTTPNSGFSQEFASFIQKRIVSRSYSIMAKELGWPRRTSVKDSLAAAEPYMRSDLEGEAVLTIGGPVHEWREGVIDGAVSVGPLECMPNKVSEAQFFHVAEQEGLLTLTLALNGDPVDPEIIDNFAFEVHERFRHRDERVERPIAPAKGKKRAAVARFFGRG